jgi:hypothetical protein
MTRFWFTVAGAIVGITLFFELIFRPHAHPHFWWHATPMFDLPFGFVGCAIIILVSKWLGRTWLQRAEGYYEDEPS